MDILRKGISVAFIFMAFAMLQAQDPAEVRKAFADSYAFESEADYTDAINSLKNIYDPASYHINLRLGWLKYLSGQFTESAAYYLKAVELKPYAIEARFGLTYPASSMGNWAQVKDQYIKILEIDPQKAKAHHTLAVTYFYLNRLDYARTHVKRAQELNYDISPSFLENLNMAHFKDINQNM